MQQYSISNPKSRDEQIREGMWVRAYFWNETNGQKSKSLFTDVGVVLQVLYDDETQISIMSHDGRVHTIDPSWITISVQRDQIMEAFLDGQGKERMVYLGPSDSPANALAKFVEGPSQGLLKEIDMTKI